MIFINTISFFLCLCDKKFAIRGKRRIKEETLIFISALGGGAGTLVSMLVFRHKTRKKKFIIGVPLLIIAWAVLIYFILKIFHTHG